MGYAHPRLSVPLCLSVHLDSAIVQWLSLQASFCRLEMWDQEIHVRSSIPDGVGTVPGSEQELLSGGFSSSLWVSTE